MQEAGQRFPAESRMNLSRASDLVKGQVWPQAGDEDGARTASDTAFVAMGESAGCPSHISRGARRQIHALLGK